MSDGIGVIANIKCWVEEKENRKINRHRAVL